jgi:hypothetical protein
MVGEETGIPRQIKAIPRNNKIITVMTEEVEGEGECRPGVVGGEDRCRDRQRPMEFEADMIKEVVGKAEGILPMVVQSAEEGDHRP